MFEVTTTNKIRITRGDTARFVITFTGLELYESDEIIFTVRRYPDTEARIIEKRYHPIDNEIEIVLSTEDTVDLFDEQYYWDVRLLRPSNENGMDVFTPIPPTEFRVMEVVGDAE